MLNASSRDARYLSTEVQAMALAGGLCLLGALALIVRFASVRTPIGYGSALFLLNVSPSLAVLLISVPLGFLYGRLSLSKDPEIDFSLADTLTLLNEISLRQIESGNPGHVSLVTNLARETEAAKQTASIILDKLWQVRAQLSQVEIQDELAIAIGARRLRVWIRDEKELRVNDETIMEFRIEPFQRELNDNSFGPKANSQGQNILLLYVMSNQVEVKGMPLKLVVPDSGPSNSSKVVITPKTEGRCSLSLVITTYPALELLQSYTTTIEVLPRLEEQQ